jgi:hypothetical protein
LNEILTLNPTGIVLNLGVQLWGNLATQKIVVRDCYERYATSIMAWLDSPAGGEALVAGTKGIGKSVFGLFLVLRLLRAGWIVFYHREARMMLVGPEATADQKNLVKKRFEDYRFASDISPGVYCFENPKEIVLFGELILASGLTHVLDLGEDPPPLNFSGKARKVVISSPNTEKLRRFVTERGHLKSFFMPLWTLEELKHHAKTLGVTDLVDLKERFDMFGGVIRNVVELPRPLSEVGMNKALNEATPADMSRVLSMSFSSLPKADLRSSLIHTVPLENNINDSINVFASNWVVRMLLSRFRKDSAFQLKTFIEGCSGLRATSAMRGILVEQSTHDAMIKGGASFTLADLEDGSPSFVAMSALPALVQVEFEGQSLDALKRDFKPFDYALPLAPNFEAIDAFAVIPRASFVKNSFVKKAKGLRLVMFQVTVARTHDVTASGLRRVYEGVLERLSKAEQRQVKAGPVYLVFITDKTGVFEKQQIKYKRDEAPLDFVVHQLAMCAASVTDEVAKLFV